jgi:hypothetical protein
MKNIDSKRKKDLEIPPFDFENSKPNKYAKHYREGAVTIIHSKKSTIKLDPDVAKYFQDSESVNIALRSLISSISEIKKAGIKV